MDEMETGIWRAEALAFKIIRLFEKQIVDFFQHNDSLFQVNRNWNLFKAGPRGTLKFF